MKNWQYIKRWWQVAKPSKTIMFFQWLTATIPAVLLVIQAIPAAKAITAITIADYDGAIKYLILTFIVDLMSQISWTIQYRFCSSQLKFIYPRIQEQIFNKIFIAEDMNFKYTSKEKMVNIISNNITVLSDFCDYISYKTAYFIQAVITIIIIFTTNFYIGLIIFALAIIVYFLINWLNSLIGKKTALVQEERDTLTENFTDIVDGRTLSNDLNLKDSLKEKYFGKVNSVVKNYSKRITLQSLRDNWVYVLYTFIIMIATLFLVKQVENNALTLTTYLIVTPYLTSAITKMKDFFAIFNDLQNTNISALRVKTILDMSEKDLIEFGNNSTDKIEGAITFSNVSYSSYNKLDKSLNSIKMLNTQITKKQIVLFQGQRNCGKRALFYMLRRASRPDNGTITFDTINIYDFDVETYKHNLSYITNKPYFFNDTILENLRYIEPNKKKVFEVCKKLGIHEIITNLPEGYETNLTKTPTALSDPNKFLLGLARAVLTKSEIFMIYEFPVGLNKNEEEIIKNTLKELKKQRTILIFSADNKVADIIDRHFIIKAGEVSEIETNKKES